MTKKKERRLKLLQSQMKVETLNDLTHINKKDSNIILWTIVCQQLRYMDELETFLETEKLPKLTQEEIENLNRPLEKQRVWVSS